MKTKCLIQTGITAAYLVIAQQALAAGGPGEGMGFWTILFLGFGAVVILLQAVPAFLLFGSMVSSLFKKPVLKGVEEAERAK